MKYYFLALALTLLISSCGSASQPEDKIPPPANVKSEPKAFENNSSDIQKTTDSKSYLLPANDESYRNFLALYNGYIPNTADIKVAQSIIDLKKRDTISEIKPFINQMTSLVESHESFKSYLPWIKEISELANKKLIFDRLTYCDDRWKENRSTVFDSHIEAICHQSMKEYMLAKGGKFPEGWDVDKIWSFIKRRPFFYFSSNENVFIVKKSILSLKKEDQVKILSNYSEKIIPDDLAPHSSILQLITSSVINGNQIMLDLNARRQQRRELSQELGSVYSTGGEDVDPTYYESFTSDLIQTTNQNKIILGNDYLVPRLLMFSDFLIRNSKQELARKVLDHIKDNFPLEEIELSDFHFNYLWSYITTGDIKSSLQYADKRGLITKFDTLDSRLQYWIAHGLQADGQSDDAINKYATLVNLNPLTYYSIMAMKNIKLQDESLYEKLITNNFNNKNELLKPLRNWKDIFKNEFVRLATWSKLASYAMITQEFQSFQNQIEQEISTLPSSQIVLGRSQIYHAISVVFNANKSYLSTFRFMGQAIQQRKIIVDYNFIQTLFPTPYEDLVKNNSQDIDHVLLYGLIRQESGFDPKARSAVGATGLMQLMPYTARMIDRSLASDLTNPKNNVAVGTKYLKRLMDKYNNNLVYSLGAYNAGDHRVNNWINTYFKHESILYNIESIPYSETRNYVKLILRNMFFYKLLEEQDVKDSLAFNELFNIKLGFTR